MNINQEIALPNPGPNNLSVHFINSGVTYYDCTMIAFCAGPFKHEWCSIWNRLLSDNSDDGAVACILYRRVVEELGVELEV